MHAESATPEVQNHAIRQYYIRCAEHAVRFAPLPELANSSRARLATSARTRALYRSANSNRTDATTSTVCFMRSQSYELQHSVTYLNAPSFAAFHLLH